MSLSKIRMSKGFTLIELMIVVAIIGILAAVAVPKFADLVTKSKEAAVKGNLGAVRSAISIYYGDTEGVNPANGLLLTALTTNNRYMNSQTGLGDFTIPSFGSFGGHPNRKIITDAGAPATFNDATAAQGGVYDGSIGLFYANCSHNDTKGVVWTAN